MEHARRVLELMFLTAWADGRFVGSEALTIHRLAAQVPLLREAGPAGDVDVSAKRKLAEVGLETCVREAAAAIAVPSHRELAFQCCAKVGGADGAFSAQEAQVLRILREVWGFTDEDVQRILVLATTR
jgi:tellurite resistance protein